MSTARLYLILENTSFVLCFQHTTEKIWQLIYGRMPETSYLLLFFPVILPSLHTNLHLHVAGTLDCHGNCNASGKGPVACFSSSRPAPLSM